MTERLTDGEWQEYQRTNRAEMRPWVPGMAMERVSVSAADAEAGSPKPGDMIARNPANHDDQWLVARDYFAANFAAVPRLGSPPAAGERGDAGMGCDCTPWAVDCRDCLERIGGCRNSEVEFKAVCLACADKKEHPERILWRSALENWGQHHPWCFRARFPNEAQSWCNCGLEYTLTHGPDYVPLSLEEQIAGLSEGDKEKARAFAAKLATPDGTREAAGEATRIASLREALNRIADGATGYLDRDTTLAGWARRALRDDDAIVAPTGPAAGAETGGEG